jgi:MFS family permease
MLSFVFVSIDSLQPLLFQKSFQIDRKQQIENFKNALVIIFDIAVKLVCAPVFGYLADRYGRKNVNIYGIIIISVTMFLMPYAPNYWMYVILRCVYATGKTIVTQVPSPSQSFLCSLITSAIRVEEPLPPFWFLCLVSEPWGLPTSTLPC